MHSATHIKLQYSLKQMTQLSKRTLRERRPHKSFDSDNEDQDPWGYAKPSTYAKEQQKTLSPAQQLMSDAKLFVKFLAAINKSYKEQQASTKKKEQEAIKEPVPVRERKGKVEGDSEVTRKGKDPLESKHGDSLKKTKEGYGSKSQSNPHIENSHPKPDPASVINKYKALHNESASKMLSMQSGLVKGRPMGGSKPGKEAIFKNGGMGSFPPGNPSQAFFNGQNNSSPSFFPINKQKVQKVAALTAQLNIPKPTIAENKIFKRSAFHVAIAYHIYLNKLREKGTVGNEIDPTYYARRLKEGMHKY